MAVNYYNEGNETKLF